jgi:Tfp pilus assembly protein PilF
MAAKPAKEVNDMSKRSLSALAVLLFLPIAGSAQNSMIRGKVHGSNGAALNNALVELTAFAGALAGQVLTRNDGDFSFANLGAGEYQVLVIMSGYEPGREVVQLRGGSIKALPVDVNNEVVTIEITLRPRPEAALAAPGTSFVQDVPKAARSVYAKGMAKIREGKSDEGIAFLREATVEYEDYFDAHFALGSEYYRRGKDAEALEALERARQINDREAAVYYTFGMVMLRQQKFRTAEYAFGKAVELNTSHVASHFNHAVALIELVLRTTDAGQVKSNLAQADRELDSAWELSGKRLNTVFLQRARIYQERGDREAAARELESYLKAEPDAKNAAAVKAAIGKLREKKK